MSCICDSCIHQNVCEYRVCYVSDFTKCSDYISENNPKICKTCKHYKPYTEQFTNIPRGDGYCEIERMSQEGIVNINCDDYFGCAYYQKGE